MSAMETTTLELPIDIGRELDEIAERTGRSRTDLIHAALRDFLDRQHQGDPDPGWPRSIGMIDDPEVNSENLEDWLQANWRPEDDWGRS